MSTFVIGSIYVTCTAGDGGRLFLIYIQRVNVQRSDGKYEPPVDAVCMSPAAVRVRVPMARVDEGVFERSADVLSRQSCH